MFMNRHLQGKLLLLLLLMCALFTAYHSPPRVLAQDTDSVPAAELDANPAVDWMKLLYDRIFAAKINPPAAARLYAYGGITEYEAVLPGMPGYISLSGQLTDMPDMPAIEADAVYDWSSSLTGAMSVLLPAILPANDETTQKINLLRQQQENARKRAVDPEIVDRSLAYGESVGQAIIAWAAADHAKEAEEKAKTYTLPDDINSYVLTTEGTKPVEPYWGMVRPFGIPSSDACDSVQDMPFSEDPKSTFYQQALEVKNVGDHLTQEQKDIATFWVDTPGITGTPGGHWIMLMAQMASDLNLKLDRTVEGFALVGVGVGDAFISGWNIKYIVMLMRPVTYIQRFIQDSWQPFIQTPPFPEFISGHSIVSETAATLLTSLYGTVAFTDNTERFRNLQSRSFTSFQAAASEAAISRLYGGIHFRTGIEKGLDQGRCVARNILDRIHFK